MKAIEKLKTIVLTGRIYDLDREKIVSKLDEKDGGLQRLKRLKYWVLSTALRF